MPKDLIAIGALEAPIKQPAARATAWAVGARIIESGRGELRWGETVRAFGPDTTLVIPPNVNHQIVNTGAEPMKLIAALSVSPVEVYLPGGQPFPLPWPS